VRVLLKVASGTHSATAILRPGETLRVGRALPADWIFAEDHMMSRMHFCLECTPDGCRIIDLNSANGTLLASTEITVASLADVDDIVAGEIRFVVRIEHDRGRAPAASIVVSSANIGIQPMYAVVDAAKEPGVLKMILDTPGTERDCLLGEARDAQLVHFAPHLVRLANGSQLREQLTLGRAGVGWGILIVSDAPKEQLRAHLVQLLRAKLSDGREMHFRYYDPRILKAFLPSCLEEEVAAFFGPVTQFVLQENEKEDRICFSRARRGTDHDPTPPGTASKTKGRMEVFSIRKEQLAILGEVETVTVTERMLNRIRREFPKQLNAIGEAGVREMIRFGRKRAAGYGLSSAPDVEKFVDVMLMFGLTFDADERLPWVQKIFRARANPHDRIRQLHEAACSRFPKVQQLSNECS
jgi:hypothetical protein